MPLSHINNNNYDQAIHGCRKYFHDNDELHQSVNGVVFLLAHTVQTCGSEPYIESSARGCKQCWSSGLITLEMSL